MATATQMKLPVLLSYGTFVYRPAGYRIPEDQELYVNRDGHIKKQLAANNRPKEARLIVREYRDEDFKTVRLPK